MAADNRALVLRHHDEIWSKGDLDAADEIFAPDFIGHHPGTPDWIGPAGVKLAVTTEIRLAEPDHRDGNREAHEDTGWLPRVCNPVTHPVGGSWNCR